MTKLSLKWNRITTILWLTSEALSENLIISGANPVANMETINDKIKKTIQQLLQDKKKAGNTQHRQTGRTASIELVASVRQLFGLSRETKMN